MSEDVNAQPKEEGVAILDKSHEQWFVADGIPGTGARPEWLQTKYPSLEAQAKAYAAADQRRQEAEKKAYEYQKKLEERPKAPEAYQIPSFNHIKPKMEDLQDFLDYAKANDLPQPVLEEIFRNTDEMVKRATYVDEDFEASRLGADGPRIKERIETWAHNNLGEHAQEALKNIPKKAEVLYLLSEVIKMENENMLVTPAATDSATGAAPVRETVKQVQDELMRKENMDRLRDDPLYQREINERLAKALEG